MLGVTIAFLYPLYGTALINDTVVTTKGKTLKLVWNDEFNSNSLDTSKWKFDVGYLRNNEIQYYTYNRYKNLRFEDGKLIIEAHREKYDYGKGIASCTSAEITTFGKASWKYGRFEIKAKVPKGKGTWPALWMMGTNIHSIGWPRCGEIDIMEYVGFNPSIFHFTLHGSKNRKHTGTGSITHKTTKPEESMGIFVVEWDEEGFRYIIDDVLVGEVKREAIDMDPYPFDAQMFLLINLAIGGNWGGQQGVDESIFPARYEIDYVRIYQ